MLVIFICLISDETQSTNVRGRSVSKSTPARAKADDDW